MRAGAHGFIGKTQHESERHVAIRAVAAGRTYFSQHLANAIDPIHPAKPSDEPVADRGDELLDTFKLSAREHEVLRCLLNGMSITAIAKTFSRSVTTISAQKHSAFRKLGLRTNHELFRVWCPRG
ncbi:helix-turn-helix transcriptional regulator [Dyella choica]|nr:response regulator transcription factor [Dyella choica]